MKRTPLCNLLNIDLPLIQGGMVWVSGAKLAAAASNAGCLGVIGSGSMKPELLRSQILKAQSLTKNPIAVNIPILYSQAKEQIDCALELGIKIFITSAGSPKKFTSYLKNKNCLVIHVTSNPELALKCEAAGVDAVVVEGFEAGGHNGRDELTSLVLIPQVVARLKIPIIAAGGFASGQSILAAQMLGAQAVQMGTRFMMTKESSAHENYKNLLLNAGATDTELVMKKHVPVRLLKNKFYSEVKVLEDSCASKEELVSLLGRGRAKSGMLDGDIANGELETGQICSAISDIPTVANMIENLKKEYQSALQNFKSNF